jgi:hypothetical protein
VTGWKIFSHSVFLLNHNFKDALRISSPLILAMVLSFVMGGANATGTIGTGAIGSGGSPNETLSILLQVLTGIAGLWVAVAWHRFVLLEEHGGTLPAFHGRRMLSYFVVILLLIFVLALVGGAAGALIGLAFGVSTLLFMVGILAIFVSAFWIFYRLSPMLPAAALGRSLGPAEAWGKTTGLSGAILVSGLSLIVASLLGGAVAMLVMFQISIVMGVILLGLLQWAYTMVGISILTTIYGMAIEGREI